MPEETELTPLDDRGQQLLDWMEVKSKVRPWRTNTRTGARVYNIEIEMAETMLDQIDPDWREHLTRVPQ